MSAFLPIDRGIRATRNDVRAWVRGFVDRLTSWDDGAFELEARWFTSCVGDCEE